MDFIKKNDFTVKHKSDRFFEQDLNLFKEHCKESRLHPELKRANSYNKKILDGYMLFELLDKVSGEKILANRKKADAPVPPAVEAEIKEKETRLKEKESELEEKEEILADREEQLDDREADLIKKAEELKESVKATASKKKASTASSPE